MQKRKHPIYQNLFLTIDGEIYSSNDNLLKQYERKHDKRGKYRYLQFYFKGKQYKKKIKDLMMETFGTKKDIVINIDEDYTNNSFENLETLTYEQYVARMFPEAKVEKIERLGLEYIITSSGELFSTIYEIIMNKNLDRQGYEYVSIKNKDEEKKFKIHRLVAETFIPNPENKKTVNHIDAVKTNNNIENLEWATIKEQAKHKSENDLWGERPLKRKVKMIKNGEGLMIFDSMSEAAKFVGTTTIEISTVARGMRKSAKGYQWEFVEECND